MISHNEIENSPIENNFLTYNDKINKFFIKYVTLINDFINYAVNNLPMDSPETFKTNIHKGIQAITHIFKILLIYSNNINHTIDTTQKCFFYYVEFVTQISNSNDHIQLSLNDAIIFLYKKSIFVYEEDNKELDKSKISAYNISFNLQKLIDIHNELIYYYISAFEKHNCSFNNFTKNIYLFTENIISVNTINNIHNIHQFITYSKINNINFVTIINTINQLIKYLNENYIDSTNVFKNLIKINLKNVLSLDESHNLKNVFKLLH